jgi:glutamate/aspartate transport system substrate-binding protein
MAGKNIGVVAGTTNARAVRDQLARRNLSATLVEFRDRREGIAALARGDLDGFASDKFVLLALARAENLRDFTLLPDDLSFEPFAIMLPRGDWAFRLAVNTALAHVFRSGEILGLYTKYIGGVGLGRFQLGWRRVYVWWPARVTAGRRGDRIELLFAAVH